jgi:hypothetical protein
MQVSERDDPEQALNEVGDAEKIETEYLCKQ